MNYSPSCGPFVHIQNTNKNIFDFWVLSDRHIDRTDTTTIAEPDFTECDMFLGQHCY